MNPLDELKPFIVSYLHADRIQKFREVFKQSRGREPTHDELNVCISFLIANGNINQEANEITQDLINKIINKSRPRNIFINSSFTMPLCIALLLFLWCLSQGKVPEALQSGMGFYGTTISVVILLILTLLWTILGHTHKDQ
jgi:hypothetical protein